MKKPILFILLLLCVSLFTQIAFLESYEYFVISTDEVFGDITIYKSNSLFTGYRIDFCMEFEHAINKDDFVNQIMVEFPNFIIRDEVTIMPVVEIEEEPGYIPLAPFKTQDDDGNITGFYCEFVSIAYCGLPEDKVVIHLVANQPTIPFSKDNIIASYEIIRQMEPYTLIQEMDMDIPNLHVEQVSLALINDGEVMSIGVYGTKEGQVREFYLIDEEGQVVANDSEPYLPVQETNSHSYFIAWDNGGDFPDILTLWCENTNIALGIDKSTANAKLYPVDRLWDGTFFVHYDKVLERENFIAMPIDS